MAQVARPVVNGPVLVVAIHQAIDTAVPPLKTSLKRIADTCIDSAVQAARESAIATVNERVSGFSARRIIPVINTSADTATPIIKRKAGELIDGYVDSSAQTSKHLVTTSFG